MESSSRHGISRLAKQPNNNYYLSRPTQQTSSKPVSSSVNQQGDKISLNQAECTAVTDPEWCRREKGSRTIVEYRQKNGDLKPLMNW